MRVCSAKGFTVRGYSVFRCPVRGYPARGYPVRGYPVRGCRAGISSACDGGKSKRTWKIYLPTAGRHCTHNPRIVAQCRRSPSLSPILVHTTAWLLSYQALSPHTYARARCVYLFSFVNAACPSRLFGTFISSFPHFKLVSISISSYFSSFHFCSFPATDPSPASAS